LKKKKPNILINAEGIDLNAKDAKGRTPRKRATQKLLILSLKDKMSAQEKQDKNVKEKKKEAKMRLCLLKK